MSYTSQQTSQFDVNVWYNSVQDKSRGRDPSTVVYFAGAYGMYVIRRTRVCSKAGPSVHSERARQINMGPCRAINKGRYKLD